MRKGQLLSLPLVGVCLKLNHGGQAINDPFPGCLPPKRLQAFSRTARIPAPQDGTPWVQLCGFFYRELVNAGVLEKTICVSYSGNGATDISPALLGVVSLYSYRGIMVLSWTWDWTHEFFGFGKVIALRKPDCLAFGAFKRFFGE